MSERPLPGIKKLVEAERTAKENARPEPIYTDLRQLEPRLVMPSQDEVKELKRSYGIRYLGDSKSS